MPLITITASFGTKGNEIAQIVAQKLGVGFFDDGELKSIVTETGITVPTEYNFDQHAPGFWERLRSREPQLYLDAMEAAVYDIARHGDGVIIGHGSQMLLRDFECAFHVRLLSNINTRVENLVSSQGLNRDSALNLIAKYDKGQEEFFRYAFRIDLDSAVLYDLVINMGKMTKGKISNLIMEAVRSDDIQSCSLDALSSMKRLSQERKIHAELLENNIDISTLNIAVPEIGRAHITGAAVSQDEMNRIAEIVRNVNGISHVTADLSVWIYPL
ncbi:MAG: cytidylate kinase family protein [Desulfobacterales bacterium]|jgi:cytidylate kinase